VPEYCQTSNHSVISMETQSVQVCTYTAKCWEAAQTFPKWNQHHTRCAHCCVYMDTHLWEWCVFTALSDFVLRWNSWYAQNETAKVYMKCTAISSSGITIFRHTSFHANTSTKWFYSCVFSNMWSALHGDKPIFTGKLKFIQNIRVFIALSFKMKEIVKRWKQIYTF